MFSNLVSYLIGSAAEQPEPESPNDNTQQDHNNIRLNPCDEDDWVLVDRDSEGNSEASSESLKERLEDLLDVPTTFERSSSSSSLPYSNMEESWFITPPPIFTSSGPIEVETSPFENLLIEHPSMSVYHQHAHPLFRARRHPLVPDHQHEELIDEVDVDDDVAPINNGPVVAEAQAPRRNRLEAIRQEERQRSRSKQGQKLQIQKACNSLKKGYMERTNKAREVNCRNQRLRRGERSQGAKRSHANNNRKC